MDVDLFYTADAGEFREFVAKKLTETYEVRVRDRGMLPVFDRAFDPARRQFHALVLLDYLARCIVSDTALWVVDRDMYCGNLNFVFGLAMYHIAAVVSTFRVDTAGMVAKEAIHETGHILGLQHCPNRCVMRFSESLEDALEKPDSLCAQCRKILNRKLVQPGVPM